MGSEAVTRDIRVLVETELDHERQIGPDSPNCRRVIWEYTDGTKQPGIEKTEGLVLYRVNADRRHTRRSAR